MTGRWTKVPLLGVLMAWPAAAGGGIAERVAVGRADANAILAAADALAEAFSDQSYLATMEIRKGGKARKTLEFRMVMKGLEKQLITFLAPGDVAGMKVLLADRDTLYVYTPEFKKVRRVAAHAQNQGFLGSTFTYEDMTLAKLSASFTAELGGKEGAETTLRLTPRPGVRSSYPRLELVIDATRGGVTRIRYYSGTGEPVREQLRNGWIDMKGTPMPTEIHMRDLKSGHETVIRLSDIKVNENVPDSAFERRMLLRG